MATAHDIEQALRAALPAEALDQAADFAQLLSGITGGLLSPAEAKIGAAEARYSPLLQSLSGLSLAAGGETLSFDLERATERVTIKARDGLRGDWLWMTIPIQIEQPTHSEPAASPADKAGSESAFPEAAALDSAEPAESTADSGVESAFPEAAQPASLEPATSSAGASLLGAFGRPGELYSSAPDDALGEGAALVSAFQYAGQPPSDQPADALGESAAVRAFQDHVQPGRKVAADSLTDGMALAQELERYISEYDTGLKTAADALAQPLSATPEERAGAHPYSTQSSDDTAQGLAAASPADALWPWDESDELADEGYLFPATPSQPLAPAPALLQLPLDALPDRSPLPTASRMPYPAMPLFVGRESQLHELAAAMQNDGIAIVGQNPRAAGVDGVGKTQLAAEFVHRYGQYFAGGVFWINCEHPAAVAAEIALCGGADHLNLHPAISDLPVDEQAQMVSEAWQSSIPRLVVFDHCEDPALLEQWRPAGGGCRVLVTSRRARELAAGGRFLELDVLRRAESILLLCRHRADFVASDAALYSLAAELGDCPLALQLAGRFLAAHRDAVLGTPAAYLVRLRQAQVGAAAPRNGSSNGVADATSDTARALGITYEYLKTTEPADTLALRLLAAAACFAPGVPIAPELLIAAALRSASAPLPSADAALARLRQLGLIETGPAGLWVERSLAAIVRAIEAEPPAHQLVIGVLFQKLHALLKAGATAQLLALQAHLRVVTDAASERGDELAAKACEDLSQYLWKTKDIASARRYAERALEIAERRHGLRHLDTIRRLSNLARLYEAQGDYPKARVLVERELAICEQTFGPAHAKVARTLSRLARLLSAQKEYVAARVIFERALSIDEQIYGKSHPEVANDLCNVASMQARENLPGARALLERALAIRERALGSMHPDTADCLNNLAILLYTQHDYPAARAFFERALAIREQASGPIHQDTAQCLNNLGVLCYMQRDHSAARAFFERALAIREQILGPFHPQTVKSLYHLARLLSISGDTAAALMLYEHTLALCESLMGPEHPLSKNIRARLAVLVHV